MSVTVALLNTAMGNAVAALRSSDFDTALTEALAAMGYLLALGNRSHGDAKLDYTESGIQAFITEIRREKNAAQMVTSGGIQRTKITYARVTS